MDDPTTFLGYPTDTVNAFAGSVTAISALVATGFAVRGISSWRDEMKGRRKAELAEEVLASFYEAQEQIGWIRFPGSFGGEAGDRPKHENETPDQARLLDTYYPAIGRMQSASDFFSTFFARKHRFRAVFGDQAAKQFQEIKMAHAEIGTAYRSIARLVLRGDVGTQLPEASQRVWDRSEDRIWEDHAEPDLIKDRVANAVNAIEAICRPAIEARAK